MSKFKIADKIYNIDLVVFDKDGLMFESMAFWIALAQARLNNLNPYLTEAQQLEWLATMQVSGEQTPQGVVVTGANPQGVLALAATADEAVVTGAFLARHNGMSWNEAKDLAILLFAQTDETLDLKASLTPRKGFPAIFKRLREAGVPYGVATSDDYQRVVDSINLYDDASHLSFIVTPKEVKRGKPHPDMLERIAQITGVHPSRMLMLGDSLVDVEMAKAAGAVGVGLPEHPGIAEKMAGIAAAVIDSLEDIEILV